MRRRQRRPEDMLPLPTQLYHVLLALRDETLHGYGIIRRFEELTEGEQTLLPGSLYATLSRMVELGLLERAAAPRGETSGGPQRRYYRATSFGRAVASAETARLEWLVSLARRGPLVRPAAKGRR
jgi:DNA-binding PadR family transcriptional regulator